MQLLNVFAVLTMAVSSAYGSVIDTSAVEAVNLESRSTCSSSDVSFIKERVDHYNVFCEMYTALTTAACKCILASYNGNPASTSAPAATAACATADSSLIKNEYYYPPAFCSWWNLETRTRSPIPGVSAAEVTKACKCYSSSTSTAVKVTSTTKKTTSSTKKTTSTSTSKSSTTTSASACKKRRKRTVAVPAVAQAQPTVFVA